MHLVLEAVATGQIAICAVAAIAIVGGVTWLVRRPRV